MSALVRSTGLSVTLSVGNINPLPFPALYPTGPSILKGCLN